MVRQHDPARPDPHGLGAARDVSDHDRSGGTGNPGKVVMFRYPIAVITPSFGVLGEVERVAQSQRCVTTFEDRRKIEQRIVFHR